MSDAYLIIYNARPGARAEGIASRLSDVLGAHGFKAELWPTRAGMAGLDEIEPGNYRGIIAVGGDGTLHHLLNGLRSFPVPIGFLGTGTVNVLTRELKLPTNPSEFAEMVMAGKTIEIPQLRVNRRRCVLFPEAGFLGRIVKLANDRRERRTRHGQFEYLWCAVSTIPRSWGRRLRATVRLVDGGTVDRSFSNLLITRVRLYAGKLPMPIDKSIKYPLQERSLECVGYRTVTPLGHSTVLLLAFLRLLQPMKALLHAAGIVECYRASSVRIEGPKDTMSHVDAETFGEMPMEIRFEGESFSLFVRK